MFDQTGVTNMPILLSIAGFATIGGSIYLGLKTFEQIEADYAGLFGTWRHLAHDAVSGLIVAAMGVCGSYTLLTVWL